MLKKAKAEARADTSSAKDRAQSMLDSSRQIWLAGLGAFARAKGEGRKVFDTLVKQGESLEKETRSAAASTAAAAREAAAEGAARVQTIAGDTWDKLEKVFEDRVAKALARLGVHTQSDVEQLSRRVDALADAVNELIRAQGGKPRAPRKASPVKRIVKSTTKRAARTKAKAALGK
ncbi:MAG TPA: phasin family protein [Casimicrobiaceae bacterium]|nr:phasin family protein [Casimicrobiaceae bacterium]